MAVDRSPVLKRCRSLDLDPVHIGTMKKSKRMKQGYGKKMSGQDEESEKGRMKRNK